MGKSDWMIIGIICLTMLTFISGATKLILEEIQAFKRSYREDMREHEMWLFNQLYSMAPGKVLKPDEVDESTDKMKSRAAKVYNPNKDPMNEFNGKKTDYFV
jgi:hypothetical protein